MKHKIVLEHVEGKNYLVLYRKTSWLSPWRYVRLDTNDVLGRQSLEKTIAYEMETKNPVVVATYTDGKQDPR